MEYEPFRYMAWAKDHAGRGRYPLHQSGMPTPSFADLGVDPSAIQLSGPVSPVPDLVAAIGERYDVDPACVLPTAGTHHANLLAALALAGPGSKVLVENPTYEDLTGVFKLVGAEVLSFRREPANGWRLPMPDIVKGLDDGATIVAVANLHNPSGALLEPSDLAALEGAARDRDAVVLLDEVYRDFLEVPFGTSFRPEAPFLVTSSLTKAYGLGDVRLGWAFARPEIRERMREIDAFGVVNLPAPVVSLVLAAWDRLPEVLERHRDLAGRNRRIVAAWVRGRDDVDWCAPTAGITGFIRVRGLQGKDDVAWCESLIDEDGVGTVPGTMFGEPGSLRISWGMDPELLKEGLSALGQALDRLDPT
ncbi:MAG: aminotransferase class I/II-fold pyridoxal phosphate-dependent enzyme [Planctomycetota bacterium]|jgi:aspartate/methionine/tyrosine aminotransferase